jgi:hypothetical protein
MDTVGCSCAYDCSEDGVDFYGEAYGTKADGTIGTARAAHANFYSQGLPGIATARHVLGGTPLTAGRESSIHKEPRVCFYMQTGSYSYAHDEARSRCQERRGADIASIHSEAENNLVKALHLNANLGGIGKTVASMATVLLHTLALCSRHRLIAIIGMAIKMSTGVGPVAPPGITRLTPPRLITALHTTTATASAPTTTEGMKPALP